MMKKKYLILTGVALVVLVIGMTGCGSSGTDEQTQAAALDKADDGVADPDLHYDYIYERYASKLQKSGRDAVKDLHEEAGEVDEDIYDLEESAADEVEDMAETLVEGGDKIYKRMLRNGDKYSVYEKYYTRLYHEYYKHAMSVYEAYVDRYAETVQGVTEDKKREMLKAYKDVVESMAPTEF